MSRFHYAHASATSWEACVKACAGKLGRPGRGLGFAYFTDAFVPHAKDIVRTLREATGVADWVGTVGVGILATGVEYLDQPALAVMVADFDAGHYQVFSGRTRPPPPGERMAGGAFASHFAVVHADPQAPDVAGLIADMSSKVESGYLVGGLSSSRTQTVQVANDVVTGGLSGVVLASDIGLTTRLTQGCAALPGRHRITRCEQNVIVTLDNRPALDVFREAAGEVLARDLRRAAAFMLVGLPVAGSGRADLRSEGDYLVRNLVGIDPKNNLIAIGDTIEEGQELLFCKRDGSSARQDLERMLAELSNATPAPARGALYYSCLGRGEHMFGERGAELGIVREALGDLPLVGFFCNGEISHDRLYGYTGVLTLFH
jgi:small ligand-binding sensory domain FIST